VRDPVSKACFATHRSVCQPLERSDCSGPSSLHPRRRAKLARPRRAGLLLFLTATLLRSIVPSSLPAAILRVPEDYSTIQSAIVAASAQDTILVGPGFYDENLDTQGKYLTLLGWAGAAQTIVDGGRRASVLILSGGGLVEGFTFRRGQAASAGGGLHVTQKSASAGTVIRNNVIEDNIAGPRIDVGTGGGIYADFFYISDRVIIEGNTIRNNYAGSSGGGIRGGTEVLRNTISQNGCHVDGGGIADAYIIRENLIHDNWADSFGAGIYIGGDSRVVGNTIVRNYNYNGFPHGAGIQVNGPHPLISHNIVAYNGGRNGSGAGIRCFGGTEMATLECNNCWGNDYADYMLTAACDTTGGRNFSLDPVFCGTADYGLSSSSPCAPGSPLGCGLIGALGVACGGTPTRRSSWGRLKVLYR